MRASDSGTSDRSFLRLGRKTILAKALMRRCACVRVGGVQHTGELLGRVTVLLDEVRRMQAGRQILPLVGRARGRTATSGSITVEVRTACRIGSNSPLSSLVSRPFPAGASSSGAHSRQCINSTVISASPENLSVQSQTLYCSGPSSNDDYLGHCKKNVID